jgi:phage terminase large subunit
LVPKPSEILIDVIGLGAGVYDGCAELGLPVRGINVNEAASSLENCIRDFP